MWAPDPQTPDEAPLGGAVRVAKMAGSDEPAVPESRFSDAPSADSDLSGPALSAGERRDPFDDDRTVGLDDRDAAAWFGFLESQRRVLEALDAFTKGAIGVAVEDFEVLTALRASPDGRLRMRDLAGRLCFSPSRLSHRIDRLHDLGFVDREPVPGDRRGTFARLTEFGAETVARHLPGYVGAVRSLLLDRLERHEIEAMASGLPRVVARLRTLDNPRGFENPAPSTT